MNSSLRILTIRGIDVRLHITFPLILIWAAFQFGLASGSLNSAFFGVVAVSLLFVLVTLHELGHSFAAQYYGVPVKQIVLSPLGGVAQLSRIPEKPKQEFVIAIAGPAVNVIIALLLGALLVTLNVTLANPVVALSGTAGLTITSLLTYVFIYNIMLAVFNLIPAFPLDGGRIFRALLAMKIDYVRATNIAVSIGRLIAILLGIYGLFTGGIFLILIAVFIYTAGSQEAQVVQLRGRLRDYKVKQVYSPNVYQLSMESTIQQATNLRIYGGQQSFPIVEEGMLVGFLTAEGLSQANRTAAPHSQVANFMRMDIKPVDGEDDLFAVYVRLQEEHLDALPVAREGQFLGLIGRRQIAILYKLVSESPQTILQNQSI